MMMFIKMLISAVFLLVINITDFKELKIKNKIVLPVAVLGLVLGIADKAFFDSLSGMLLPLVLFPLFALKMLGAGDIKALCAIGAVVGFKMSILTVIFTFLCGGIIAIGFMMVNANASERIKYFRNYLKMCFVTKTLQKYDFGGDNKSYFRFAYAITAGTIFTFVNEYVHIISL